MFTHDPYMVKAIEYLVGISFLLLFVAFWRFVNGEPALAPQPAWSGQLAEWFRLPERLFFHPGHAWARFDEPDVVTVGLNDFAQQLVGPVQAVDLPQPGAMLKGGATGWTLRADGRAVDMLAPVTGTVLAVNRDVKAHGDLVNEDPYGRGWLMKVKVPRVAESLKDLATGAAARRWMEGVTGQLTASLSPELGVLYQDGGMPIHGIARGIDEAHWDDVARRFLLTQRRPS